MAYKGCRDKKPSALVGLAACDWSAGSDLIIFIAL